MARLGLAGIHGATPVAVMIRVDSNLVAWMMTRTRTRKYGFRLGLAMASAAILPGCADPGVPADNTSPGAAAVASAPARNQIDAEALTAFLQATYGADASLTQSWWTADHAARMQVCAHESMAIDARPHALLAVCGQLQDFGHVSSGPNHFYLLAAGPAGPELVAQSRDLAFGGMGGSGTARVLRLGRDLYGFEVLSGFTGQGYTTGTRTLLLPRGDTFTEAASMRSSLDNTLRMKGCLEQARCQANEAFDIELALRVDDTDPTAAAFPLQVSESGEACGTPATASYRLVLDAASLSYAVPAALQRETGCN